MVLEGAGVRVIVHDDVYPQKTADLEWLGAPPGAYAVSVTKDQGLRYRPLERKKIVEANRPVFMLTSGNLTKDVMADG